MSLMGPGGRTFESQSHPYYFEAPLTKAVTSASEVYKTKNAVFIVIILH